MSSELNAEQISPTISEYQTPSENRVWYDYGNEYYLKERATLLEKLDNVIYSISVDPFGSFYLQLYY